LILNAFKDFFGAEEGTRLFLSRMPLNQNDLRHYSLEGIALALAFHSSSCQRLPIADNIENGQK
jgi:hypothetical protein